MGRKLENFDVAYSGLISDPLNRDQIDLDEAMSTDTTKKTPDAKKPRLISRSFYITDYQYKALKLRAATSDLPEDKDMSAIVRTALDMYLSDTIKDLQ